MLKILFTRDSVCMGDDCFNNSRVIEFDDDATLEEIIPIIKNEHFLATVSGNNVVWVLENYKKYEILSYYTYTDKIIKCTTINRIEDVCDGKNVLHFKYYPTPQKREEHTD